MAVEMKHPKLAGVVIQVDEHQVELRKRSGWVEKKAPKQSGESEKSEKEEGS